MKYWKTLLCFYFGVVLGLFVQNVFWSALKNETVWSVKRFLTQSKRWFSGQRVGSAWSTHQVEEHFKWLFYCIVKWCFVSYIYIYISPFLTGCDSYGEESHRGVFSGCMVTIMFSSSCLVYYFERDLWIQLLAVIVISSLHSLFMLFVVWLLRRYSSLAQVVCMDH